MESPNKDGSSSDSTVTVPSKISTKNIIKKRAPTINRQQKTRSHFVPSTKASKDPTRIARMVAANIARKSKPTTDVHKPKLKRTSRSGAIKIVDLPPPAKKKGPTVKQGRKKLNQTIPTTTIQEGNLFKIYFLSCIFACSYILTFLYFISRY